MLIYLLYIYCLLGDDKNEWFKNNILINYNLIIYKEIYTEFSQIVERIYLNSKYTSSIIQNLIINIIQYILNENNINAYYII